MTPTYHKISNKRLCLLLDLSMLMLIAGFVAYMFMKTPKSHYDIDRTIYPVKGIDISAHNGNINFLRVAADSVSFVIIKASEGTDFTDSKFTHNYRQAKKVGLKVGAYHFFRFDTPGDQQARHLLSVVKGHELDMPLIIDVEQWGNPHNYDPDTIKHNLSLMVDVLRESGWPLMIYTNKQGYARYIKDSFDALPLWICSLSTTPDIDTWLLWQHSHEGRVNGVPTRVDVNTYKGDINEFRKWIQPYTVK